MGMKMTSIRLGDGEFTHPVIVVEGLPMEALLGIDFILQNGCVLDPAEGKIIVRSKAGMTLTLQGKTPKCYIVKKRTTACVTLKNTIRIPPFHEVDVSGVVVGDLEQGPWLIDSTGLSKKAIQVANALVVPKNGTVPVRLMNSSRQPVTVYRGDSLARMELLKSSEGVTIGSLTTVSISTTSLITPEKEAKLWDLSQRMGTGLSLEERKRVFDLLVKYEAVFPQKKETGKTQTLPRIDDTLNSLAGSKWFTALDLASGYWQVEIHVCPEDKEKTAFCTHDGHFEFNVMPFGLCNAPATFQWLMDLVLAGEHLDNLGTVLARLKAAGLTLNLEKCSFFQKKVRYLGHIVSERGVTPDPEKSKLVTGWPTPTCLIELQGFLGLANYYRHFIHGYAEVAKPLHELSRKGQDFEWTKDYHFASEQITVHFCGYTTSKSQRVNLRGGSRSFRSSTMRLNTEKVTIIAMLMPSLVFLATNASALYMMVAMDFLGPFVESEEGNQYILVVGDHFTKYMSAYALPNQEAKTVARILVDEYFCQNGFPEQLHSDQGPQFESDVIAELCKTMSIQKTRTTPYHPACNGEIERFNKTLCDILATALEGCHFTWDRHIKLACFAYNTSVHASTGYTLFYLMHGHEARLPVDILCGTPQQDNISHRQSQLRQKAYYDKKVHGERFNTGDLVWLWNPAVPRKKGYNCRKLHRAWQGPFEQLSDATYRIQHTAKRRQRQVVHFDRLKPCNPDVRLHKAIQPVETPPESPVSKQPPNANDDNLDVEEDVDDEAPVLLANEEEQSSGEHVVPEIGIAGQLPEDNQVEDNMEAENKHEVPETIADSACSSTPDEPEQDATNTLEQRRYLLRDRKEPNWFGNFVSH
ncbi:hypothetical protein EMCRGX_G009794 [Ephydatia muelleri]